jgi:hypothetical protein
MGFVFLARRFTAGGATKRDGMVHRALPPIRRQEGGHRPPPGGEPPGEPPDAMGWCTGHCHPFAAGRAAIGCHPAGGPPDAMGRCTGHCHPFAAGRAAIGCHPALKGRAKITKPFGLR